MSSNHGSSLSLSLSRQDTRSSSRASSHPCSALHERISEVCGHHARHDAVDSYTLGAHLCRQGPSEPKEGGLAHSVEPEGRGGPEKGGGSGWVGGQGLGIASPTSPVSDAKTPPRGLS